VLARKELIETERALYTLQVGWGGVDWMYLGFRV
jgi:hypothetical protein